MNLNDIIGKVFTKKDGKIVVVETKQEPKEEQHKDFDRDSMVFEAIGCFRAGKTIQETLRRYPVMDFPDNIKDYTIDTRFKYLDDVWSVVGLKEEKPLDVKLAIKNAECTKGLFVDAREAEKFQKVE